MIAVTFGRNAFDGIDNVKTVNDFTEYGIAPVLDYGFAVQLFRTEVQESVVGSVDEELRAGRVGIGSTRHGDGVFLVRQTVGRFVLNRIAGFFFVHVFIHAAALNHEAFNDAVEDYAVVEAVFNVLLEVFSSNGGFVEIEFDFDVAFVGVQDNHGFPFVRIRF
ncbi:Uncharacterised protein [Mycobacteroides abscessus subsp. massiliense]|nr:Uncharacterised protein [Mycobacteroides abscessus subsp. massiliense]